MHANMGKANEAKLCTPLTSVEERKAYYRHKFLADAEKALRPTNPDIPEDIEIADVEPISVQYHLRSNLDLFNQYGTNIDRMPRTKHTSYQREVGESSKPSVDEEMADLGSEASDIREEDIRSVEDSLERQESGVESIGNEDDADGSEEVGKEEDDEGENNETDEEIAIDFNLAAQIAEEERLDEEYDLDQDDPKYLEPQEIPSSYEITESVVDPVWLQTATEKDYCQHGKRFYRLPDGYELRLPSQLASIDKPPPKETPAVIPTRSGGLVKGAFVPALVSDFIEIPHVRIPEGVAEELAVPVGAAGDPWHPRINVNRGESVLSDDPSTGGSMGWRVLKDLATPADRPSNRIAAPCGQLMNNMLRTVNSAVEVVHMYQHYQRAADNAKTRMKKADDSCKLVVKERDKVISDVKTLQKRVSDLNRKLTDQELLQKKVASLEQSLKDEKEAKAQLASQVEKMERDKPGIRRRAVNRFLQTDLYANLLVDRYTAGWVSAHRCVCKAEGWDSTKWQAVERAFNEEMNHSPTSYESEYFDEIPPHAVITNLDPRELPEMEFDDALINSHVTTHVGEDGSAGPSNKEAEKESVNAAEPTKEADKI
uniref:Uncharacterized protein n=1 Tax=Chenopodium quinoa TaxID=63459 RepID=A0A803LU11_CHEQI